MTKQITSKIANFTMAAMGSAAILTGAAMAQNRSAPPPAASVIPARALDETPHRDLSNGIITAKAYIPGPGALYRGTRFDRAGVIAQTTYKGHNFGQYWFSSYSPHVRDFIWQDGQVTVHPASGAPGPVEEFAAIGFEEAGMGGNFLKIGTGILKRDTPAYDYVHNYPVVNEGRRGFTATKTQARYTQTISGDPSGYGYSYVKTVKLTPGKAQMTIEHVLTNTGKKAIDTKVYCHNFLTLGTGNENVTITAPFDIKAEKPFAKDAAAVEGKTFRYLRAVRENESVTSPITGFGDAVSDYDFTITNTKTGFGQRIRADQPLAQINFWSIRTNVSWEPYVAIALKPGETKRWTYTYDFFGPEDQTKREK